MNPLCLSFATDSRRPRFTTVLAVLNTVVGLAYVAIGITGALKFMLPAARIWAFCTGIFDLLCGISDRPWLAAKSSPFHLIWFIVSHLSVQLVPSFVLYHYGFHHAKLNATFGMPVLLAWMDALAAWRRYRSSSVVVPAGAFKAVDITETEGLLQADLISADTAAFDDDDTQIAIDVSHTGRLTSW